MPDSPGIGVRHRGQIAELRYLCTYAGLTRFLARFRQLLLAHQLCSPTTFTHKGNYLVSLLALGNDEIKRSVVQRSSRPAAAALNESPIKRTAEKYPSNNFLSITILLPISNPDFFPSNELILAPW